jgi:excisionase family DNA binding protein
MTADLLLNQKDTLTTRELAKILNVHINTVRKWADNGTILCSRVGKRKDRIFDKKDVQIFSDGCQHE